VGQEQFAASARNLLNIAARKESCAVQATGKKRMVIGNASGEL
jgi:hypothetical protein